MAATIITDMTLVSNCDATTGWSSGAVNSTFQLEGSGCLGVKASNTTTAVFSYTLSANTDFTGKFFIIPMLITGAADTKTNGGYRIYFEDSSGNNGTWYVGGSDTHSGGWGYFAADPSTTYTTGTGTVDYTSIAKVGCQMKTVSTALGNNPNAFFDICHYGSYIGATSLTTDTVTMDDLASASASNFYGLIEKKNGVFFCRGGIQLGATATTHINFEDSGSAIVWRNDEFLLDSYSGITILGGATTTSNVIFKNGFLKGDTTQPFIDASDVDVDDFTMDTMLMQNMASFSLDDNSTISKCIIGSSEAIDLTDGVFELTTIANTNATGTDGSINISDAASAAVLTDMKFTTYAGNNAYAVYVPAAVTSFTMDNWYFDDPNNTTDYALYWAGTAGTLTISATNGTNLQTSGCTSAGGTVSISQDVTISVTNVIVGSSVYMATLDANGDESTELINEVATGTTVSDTVNYAGLDYTDIVVRVRYSGGTTSYLPYITTSEIQSTGVSVAVDQIVDTIA